MATIPSGWEQKGKANVRDIEGEIGTLKGALKSPTRRTDGDTVMKTPEIDKEDHLAFQAHLFKTVKSAEIADLREAASVKALQDEVPGGVPRGVWLMGAPTLWKEALPVKGSGIMIGVLDTGIDSSHPAFGGKYIAHFDYVHDGAKMSEFNPHGTHVAGTIAAQSVFLRGVAPEATLVDFRVLGKDGSGSYAAIAEAIFDAVRFGCRIINMSFGGPYDSPMLKQAIKFAVNSGVLVICAVGNEGELSPPPQISYPGYYTEVVGVGAVEWDYQTGTIAHSYFSNENHEVDCCAHGFGVWSCVPNGGMAQFNGTSMASPHVAGFAALLMQKSLLRNGKLPTEEEIFAAIKTISVDVELPNVDPKTGAGFVTTYPELPKRKGAVFELPSLNENAPRV